MDRVRAALPAPVPSRRSTPSYRSRPGARPGSSLLDRAAAVARALALRYPGELVVVVAHGGVIGASMIRFLDLPDNGRHVQLHAENASITEWLYTGVRWRLVRFNDSAHLLGPDRTEVHPVTRPGSTPRSALPKRPISR